MNESGKAGRPEDESPLEEPNTKRTNFLEDLEKLRRSGLVVHDGTKPRTVEIFIGGVRAPETNASGLLERVNGGCVSRTDDLKRIGISGQVSSTSADFPALGRLFSLNSGDRTPQIICAQLAKDLQVQDTEVGLLRVQGESLMFLFPTELSKAGVIPLSSSAIAARTAKTGRSEIINNFTQLQHFSVFEMIKLGNARGDAERDAQTIQKMMSVPILFQNGKVCGVLQVSRKGFDLDSVGPDFTSADLQRLELAAGIVGRLLDA